MKKIVLLICLVSGYAGLNAQVGVNTATPHASAAMDIQSPPGGSDNRGVLLPRMTTTERLGIVSPAYSLTVFDTDKKAFFYFDGWYWIPLVPAERPHSDYPPLVDGLGNPIDFTPKISGNIELDTGNVIADTIRARDYLRVDGNIKVTGYAVNALVPTGGIIMWSGNPAAIPAGWALCDGTAGRPDLRGRFVVGYDPGSLPLPINAPADGVTENYARIKNTGGETGHLLTSAESGLAPHTHNINDPGHSHSMASYIMSGDGYANGNDNGDGALQGNSGASGTYSSGTGISIVAVGPQDATVVHENRPPYYVLAYIIKLP